jgi:hypothetical protein
VATRVKVTTRIDRNKLMAGRNSPVGRIMAAYAGFATIAAKQVQRERITRRTGRYERGFSSRYIPDGNGGRVQLTNSAPQARILEKGSKPHVIRPRAKSVLRFEVGGRIVYTRRVQHPGTRPYNILRDGARRAGRQFSRFAG